MFRTGLFFCWLVLLPNGVHAATLKVAVASNFVPTMELLVAKFEQTSPHRILLSSGSSGKHYALIKHGAPYDLFFSADSARPIRLEQEKLVEGSSRFTYALGRLALWSTQPSLLDNKQNAFTHEKVMRIAIANPRLAPYGVAAQQVLESFDLWQEVHQKIVRGENVNQAYQFVDTGNAELGLVAFSQVLRSAGEDFWLLPSHLHKPIEQQAVIIKNSTAAQAFISFIQSPASLRLIRKQGYDTP